jgi:hypothetical protein
MDDGNVTQHKKTFSPEPSPWLELAVEGIVVSDWNPGNVPVGIRAPRMVNPAFIGDIPEICFFYCSDPHALPDENEMVIITKDKDVTPGSGIKPRHPAELFCLTGFRIQYAHYTTVSKHHQCRDGIPQVPHDTVDIFLAHGS